MLLLVGCPALVVGWCLLFAAVCCCCVMCCLLFVVGRCVSFAGWCVLLFVGFCCLRFDVVVCGVLCAGW